MSDRSQHFIRSSAASRAIHPWQRSTEHQHLAVCPQRMFYQLPSIRSQWQYPLLFTCPSQKVLLSLPHTNTIIWMHLLWYTAIPLLYSLFSSLTRDKSVTSTEEVQSLKTAKPPGKSFYALSYNKNCKLYLYIYIYLCRYTHTINGPTLVVLCMSVR